MYPNLYYTDHRKAAYFKEESRSSSPSGGISRDTSHSTSPSSYSPDDEVVAEKERAALIEYTYI